MATLVSKSLLFDADAGRMVQMFCSRRRSALGSRRSRFGCRALLIVAAFAWGTVIGGPAADAISIALPGAALQVSQASSTQNGNAQQPSSPAGHPLQDADPMTHRVEERMADRRNEERQKTLVADTDKLLVLAQQLKADVDKSDKNMLSIDVVKRAEQIEKLARSVKEKMRGN